MSTSQSDQAKLDLQYRTLLILWVGFLAMFLIYYFLPAVIPWQQEPANELFRIIFNVMSPLLVAISFFVKRRFLARSVEAQDIRLVNTGFIVAAAFCEAGALLGLLDFLVAHDRYYFIPIVFALFGLVLHFPRRIHLEAASYKKIGA